MKQYTIFFFLILQMLCNAQNTIPQHELPIDTLYYRSGNIFCITYKSDRELKDFAVRHYFDEKTQNRFDTLGFHNGGGITMTRDYYADSLIIRKGYNTFKKSADVNKEVGSIRYIFNQKHVYAFGISYLEGKICSFGVHKYDQVFGKREELYVYRDYGGIEISDSMNFPLKNGGIVQAIMQGNELKEIFIKDKDGIILIHQIIPPRPAPLGIGWRIQRLYYKN